MKTRWDIWFMIALLFSAGMFLNLSAVPGAQFHQAEEDDDHDAALDEPLPARVDLRVFILRPRTVKPRNLGSCAETVDQGATHHEFTRWRLARPMTWSLNRNSVPRNIASSVDGVLNASFEAWYTGVFSQGADTRANRARFDKINAILWRKMGRSTLGTTFVWFGRDSGEVIEVDTVFNSRLPWAIFADAPDCQTSPLAYDLQNVATHEFGHWVGLEDLFDSAAKDLTMYGFSAGGEVKKRSLGTGDITGRNELTPF
jgi:hypothetical protein